MQIEDIQDDARKLYPDDDFLQRLYVFLVWTSRGNDVITVSEANQCISQWYLTRFVDAQGNDSTCWGYKDNGSPRTIQDVIAWISTWRTECAQDDSKVETHRLLQADVNQQIFDL